MNQDIWIPMSDEKKRSPLVSVLYVDDEVTSARSHGYSPARRRELLLPGAPV